MSATAIEWTDATWNPTTGCDRISPGCANCYAKTEHDRRHKGFKDGWTAAPAQYHHPFEVVQVQEDRLEAPLRWRAPRRVFVNSVSDLFHEDVPDQFITDVFGIMALAHWHTFQVLTKRPERMRSFLAAGDHGIVRQFMLLQQNGGTSTRPVFRALDLKRRDDIEWRWPLPNVWLGVSVENQHFAEERIPLLLRTPAAIRFISAEPLLSGVDLRRWIGGSDTTVDDMEPEDEHCVRCGCFWDPDSTEHECPPGFGPRLDWVIVGGESGAGARPFDIAWARSIVAQCQAAGVPVFVKQLGANPFEDVDKVDVTEHAAFGPEVTRYTEPRDLTLRSKKGGDLAEWPEDLRIREFPEAGQ